MQSEQFPAPHSDKAPQILVVPARVMQIIVVISAVQQENILSHITIKGASLLGINNGYTVKEMSDSNKSILEISVITT